MSIEALFIRVKIQKQFKCPATDEQIKGKWYEFANQNQIKIPNAQKKFIHKYK